MREERFAAGWVVPEDWLETGSVAVHLRSPKGNFEQPFVPGAQELRYAIRLSMTKCAHDAAPSIQSKTPSWSSS